MDETIRTLAWVFVLLAAIQGATIYCVVRLLTTGQAIFNKRFDRYDSSQAGGSRIVGIERP